MSLRDNRVYFIAAIIAIFAYVSIAHADESASNGTSATDANTSGFMSHMHASYFAIFHGPGVDNFSSPNTIDQTGTLSKTTRMNLDSEVNLPYNISDSVSVSPVIPFLLYTTMGSGATLGDLGFKVTDKKFISTSDVNVSANLIFQLPTNTLSKARGMEYAIKSTPSVRYVIKDTRFALGAFTEIKAYLGVTSGKAFKLYADPYVNYQITSKFSANVAYEMEVDHLKGVGSNLNFQPYQSDLMPGFIYMITPTVMINPYLQVFTTQTVDSGHMALGAIVAAAI